uniref:mitochondrial outer membrane import complex protein METAXIN n=1 Tax=Erigeron canadensis TaxID=72917 RepID=UPI001CB893CC|nr:mitochondrial outer membrane import complex protein METAXIN [Erigeron canadensis]
MEEETAIEEKLTLVARKECFGLPTACPASLPVYLYLKFSKIPFHLAYNLTFPDSDQIPYVDCDTYVAYNNERCGVIESLKEDGIVNLDKEVQNLPEWVSAIAMINSWLSDALLYELWIDSDGSCAEKIYYSDLPWPIGKVLYWKQVHNVKHLLCISNDNAERRKEEIYRRATIAYQALSTMLGDESFFFDNRPTSLDAMFLGHALIVLNALPEVGSVLRGKLSEQRNLVTYAEKHKTELLDAGSSSSDPSSSSSAAAASIPRRGPSNPSSKPRSQPKKERTEEEKSFRKKAKYFLVTQVVAVLVFLSIFSGSDDAEVDADGDEGFD